MTFYSVKFLLFFLCVLMAYFIVPKHYRNGILLILSYVFYSFFDIRFLPYLIFQTGLSYVSALVIAKKYSQTKLIFSFLILANLSMLLLFKYFNFFTFTLQRVFPSIHLEHVNFIVPLGISFFTFQSLGYLIDVYKDSRKIERNMIRYALFISYFPQLTSGPISRSEWLLKQFESAADFNGYTFESGLYQFIWGIFKKVVIADSISSVVNAAYQNYETIHGLPILFALFLYSIQIFADFSGYSDMAIGLSRMLGIGLKDNFQAPIFATSVKDFWKRWHISLSTWFRDYVYIPLGGNRKGNLRKNANLVITFLVSGLWHGASFTFIAWGLFHGLAQILEDYISKSKFYLKLPLLIKGIITFSIITIFWVFFRAYSISEALGILFSSVKITIPTNLGWLSGMLYSVLVDKFLAVKLLLTIGILVIVEFPLYKHGQAFYSLSNISFKTPYFVAILVLVILLFGSFGQTSFIYFNF